MDETTDNASPATRPSTVRAGGLLGMAVGAFDGLHATGIAHVPMSSVVVTLVVCILGGGVLGAVALPVAALLVARRGPAARREAQRRGGTVVVLLGAGLFASVIATVSHRVVPAVLPAGGSTVAAVLAWIPTILLGALVVRLLDRAVAHRGTVRALGLVAIAGVVIVGMAVVGGRPSGTAPPAARAPQPPGSTDSNRPNVVLVVLDTVRADRLSIYGGPSETSPFLTELAGESTVYDRAISPAPWTLPAHASFFTGQFPAVHQATAEHRYLDPGFVTLAEILGASGYETIGYSCNSVVGRAYNLDQGFERFVEIFRYPLQESRNPLLRTLAGRALERLRSPHPGDKGGGTVNAMVREWLGQREQDGPSGRPFFLFINYLEPHLPYLPPEPYRSRFSDAPLRPSLQWMSRQSWFEDLMRVMATPGALSPEDYRQLTALYDAELAYQDDLLRDLVDLLRDRELLDDTLLVVTSDHGENLGDHGLLNHVFSMHETLLHVPLVVRAPGVFANGVRHPGLVSTLSIFSTVLSVTGVAPDDAWQPALGPLPRDPEEHGLPFAISEYALPVFHLSLLLQHAPGTDLRPYAVRQRSIQADGWKLVRRDPGPSWAYDLARDPNESVPLSPPDEDGRTVTLERQLDAWIDDLEIPVLSPGTDAAPLDQETRDALRSLGYVE